MHTAHGHSSASQPNRSISLRKYDTSNSTNGSVNADEHFYTHIYLGWSSIAAFVRFLYCVVVCTPCTNDVDDACIAQLQCLHCNRIEMNEIDVTDGDGKENNNKRNGTYTAKLAERSKKKLIALHNKHLHAHNHKVTNLQLRYPTANIVYVI